MNRTIEKSKIKNQDQVTHTDMEYECSSQCPKEYMVVIQCATYNQEKFIGQTLESIVSQQTNFPFIVVVVDDASTDNNVNVIQEYEAKYPNIVKAIYLTENHYRIRKSKYPYFREWVNKSKYVAYCEGDDFWTDPHKLQKQVDFLESHPDYNLVCHNWNVLQDGKILPSPVHHLYTQPMSFTFATLPWVWITKTLTMMYRRSAVDQDSFVKFKYSRDVHIVYFALKEGQGYYMPEIMATYRVVDSGIWSKVDQNKKNFITYDLYKDLYSQEPYKSVRKRYMNATLAYFNGLAFGKKTWWHFHTNIKLYIEALRNISDIKDSVFCVGGLVPTRLVKWVMKTFKV